MISTDIVQSGFGTGDAVTSTQDNGKCAKTDFKSYMENNDSNKDVKADYQSGSNKNDKDEKISKVEQLFCKKEINKQNTTQKAEDVENVVMQAVENSVQVLVKNIKDIIIENTEYSQTDVEQAMECLGISDNDLISKENIKNLFLNLEGVEDASKLLTDETLSSEFTKIMNDVSEMMNTFANEVHPLNPQAVVDIINSNLGDSREDEKVNVQNNEFMNDENVVSTNMETENKQPVIVEDKAEEVQKEEKQPETVNVNDGKVEISKTAVETKETNTDSKVTDSNEIKNETINTNVQNEMQQNESDSSNQNESNQNESNQNVPHYEMKNQHEHNVKVNNRETNFEQVNGLTQNMFSHIQEVIAKDGVGQAESTSISERIMNQVLDALKVVAKEDMSSMEMQLYPEHLGKISIQVAAKEGMITAQIVAQNEAVKEVIESQLALLKENMQKQDIKIEDVEVTVASHAFEQNLSDNSNSDERGQQQKRRKNIMNNDMSGINAADIKEIEKELLEEAVMEQQGSTVSYSA